MSSQEALAFPSDLQQIGLEDYSIDFENPLGAGASATIYLASRKHSSNSEGALPKKLVFKTLSQQKEGDCLRMLRTEVDVLAGIQKHPNIVRLHGVCNIAQGSGETPRWALQIEYCKGGDLVTATQRCRFPEDRAHGVIRSVLHGLAHLHKHGFVHRDVKPDNVLLSKDGDVKLADFGISARVTDSMAMAKRCGSPGYVAPEVWLSKPYGTKIDSFSAGAVFYFVISGKLAFSGSSVQSVMQKTLTKPVNFRRSVCLERLSSSCKKFIEHLMAKDPAVRPRASEAADVSWVYPGLDDSVKGTSEHCGCADEADVISELATTYQESAIGERSSWAESFRSTQQHSALGDIPSNSRRDRFASCPGVARNSPKFRRRKYHSEQSTNERSPKVDDDSNMAVFSNSTYDTDDAALVLEEFPSEPRAAQTVIQQQHSALVDIPSNPRRDRLASGPGVARNSPQFRRRRYNSEQHTNDQSPQVDDDSNMVVFSNSTYDTDDDALMLEEFPSERRAAQTVSQPYRQVVFAGQASDAALQGTLRSQGSEPGLFGYMPRQPADPMLTPSPPKQKILQAKQQAQSASAEAL